MPQDKPKRKRVATSCTQCYVKKQKCNHQYPCDHCTRRRRPELCSYAWQRCDPTAQNRQLDQPAGSTSPALIDSDFEAGTPAEVRFRSSSQVPTHCMRGTGIAALMPQKATERPLLSQWRHFSRPIASSFASCFGYFEGGDFHLLDLMDKYGLLDKEEVAHSPVRQIPEDLVPQIKLCFQRIPGRSALDCLVRNFFEEVNWIHGFIEPRSFFLQYGYWWTKFSARCAKDVEFGILVLRVCAYSAQFLPSRSYTADTIHGLPIGTIRRNCHQLALDLVHVCEMAGAMRSFTGTQSLCLLATYLKNEGRMEDAWNLMGVIVNTAFNLGLHLEPVSTASSQIDELEREMRRRVFCNLYIWDRHWSFVMDRSPRIHDEYCSVSNPRMRLGRDAGDSNAPDAFLERSLQARLAKLWYMTICQMKGWQVIYDTVAVEEHYEGLHRNFISELPAVFDLDSPNEQWDAELPEIPKQRQLLRISIFSYICRIHSRLLKLEKSNLQSMPRYQRGLLSRHRIRLVNAAVSLLDSVAQLHSDMGGNHTKYFLISFYTFEPAMILTIDLLNAKANSSGDAQGCRNGNSQQDQESEGARFGALASSQKMENAAQCRSQVNRALERLDMLREVSPIAELAARKIHQMVKRLDQENAGQSPDHGKTSEHSDSMPILCQTPQNGLNVFSGENHCSNDLAVHQDELPELYQESWIDDLLDVSTDNSGSYQMSDSSFSTPFDGFRL